MSPTPSPMKMEEVVEEEEVEQEVEYEEEEVREKEVEQQVEQEVTVPQVGCSVIIQRFPFTNNAIQVNACHTL